MNKLYLLLLILISNNFLFSMEAEHKSLASFFGIDIPHTNEDISQVIAQYYSAHNQWWYVDKDLQHQGCVTSACFNKAGTEVLTGVYKYKNNHFCIWGSSSGTELVKEKTACSIKAAMFGEVENKIILLEDQRRDTLYFFERDKNIIRPDFKQRSLYGRFSCLNSTKTEVLGRANDGIGTICVQDTATHKMVLDIYHKMPFFSANFNNSGNEIIAMDTDCILLVFDRINEGKELLRCKHDCLLTKASFNQEGNELLVYGDFPIVYVRNRKSGEILMELAHPKKVYFACFNNEDNEICTAADDKIIRIWDRNTGKTVAQLCNEGCFQSLEWNGIGTKIVGAIDDCARIWARYDSYTLPQILLKKLFDKWLVLKKPNKKIDSSEKLLNKIVKLLHRDKGELEKIWVSFSKNMQDVIWLSMHHKIQKYGKEIKNNNS